MILHGTLQSDRSDLDGKPYTLDLDHDFVRLIVAPRPVAFSDYYPVPMTPNEYLIIDFDQEGRVVGYAFEGVLTRWADESLRNRIALVLARATSSLRNVSLASRIMSEATKKIITEATPRTDASGKLPA